MLATPEVIDAYIDFLKNYKPPKLKSKLPCTFCKTTESTTWRPGPIGPSTLCNKCGVNYMDSGKRNRTIDLILRGSTPVWLKKDVNSWVWKEHMVADIEDPRISMWIQREMIRNKLTSTYNPPPAKKRRL